MCLNETYSRGCVVKHLSDRFSIEWLEKGEALWLLPVSFALEYADRVFKGNQEGFELKGAYTYQFCFVLMTLTYWVEAYIPQREKTDALVIANKETGLEVNADKNRYLVISLEQYA
jgi:hypothetical protein